MGWWRRHILDLVERGMRVSDADREDVIARLLRAVSDGRLNLAEFGERASAAYAAKTGADLEPLTSDLPKDLW